MAKAIGEDGVGGEHAGHYGGDVNPDAAWTARIAYVYLHEAGHGLNGGFAAPSGIHLGWPVPGEVDV